MTSERAPDGSAWTTRSLAEALGLTQTAVSRIWRLHGVKPPVGGRDGQDSANGEGRVNGHGAAAPSPPTFSGPPMRDGGTKPHTRTIAAIHGLLHDARLLRSAGTPELDPLLALAIDAIERALEKQRGEPVRTRYARAETALRNARNLLAQAEAAARNVERTREAAANAAMVAIRSVADDLETDQAESAPPSRCSACGSTYRLRFMVHGAGGNVVSTRVRCPRGSCGKPIPVQVPADAERVRLEEASDF